MKEQLLDNFKEAVVAEDPTGGISKEAVYTPDKFTRDMELLSLGLAEED